MLQKNSHGHEPDDDDGDGDDDVDDDQHNFAKSRRQKTSENTKQQIRKCKVCGMNTSRSAKRTLQHQHQSNPKLTKFGSPAE